MENKAVPTQDEIYKLVKENNRMLHAMRRDAFIKGILGFIWWVFIIVVLPYLTYLYLKPYLDQIIAAYNQAQGTAHAVSAKLDGFPDFSKLLEQFMGGKK
jgi:hypothetical protein